MSIISMLPHGGGSKELHGAYIICETSDTTWTAEVTLSLGGVILQAKHFNNGSVRFDDIQVAGIYNLDVTIDGSAYGTICEVTAGDILSKSGVSCTMLLTAVLYDAGAEYTSITGGWVVDRQVTPQGQYLPWRVEAWAITANTVPIYNRTLKVLVTGGQLQDPGPGPKTFTYGTESQTATASVDTAQTITVSKYITAAGKIKIMFIGGQSYEEYPTIHPVSSYAKKETSYIDLGTIAMGQAARMWIRKVWFE